MVVASVQMDVVFACPGENYLKAEKRIREAAKAGADTVVLPETWNIGFFPKERLKELCGKEAEKIKERIGKTARDCGVNVVAGSAAVLKNEKVYNTCFVFDREGNCVAEYDKIHLFSPMGEDRYFVAGDRSCRFSLDGCLCGVILCYDLRFPELTRSLAVAGMDILFVPSQWPLRRMAHLDVLLTARAIENQIFVFGCNSCGRAGNTSFGGGSLSLDPWGRTLVKAGENECVTYAHCDMALLSEIRAGFNVFADRRPDVYRVN